VGEDYDDEEDDALDDVMDDDMDQDNDDDDEHDAEAEVDAETAAVLSLATATDMGLNENPGTNTGPEMPLPNEKIVDYCYRKGYFPASVPFPKATITTRFMEAPLIPLRPLEKNPNNKRLWNGKKPVNWCAALLQVGGAELTEPCTRCTEGNGLWKKCVVPNDWATSWNVRGACANCYVDGLRGKCSRGFGCKLLFYPGHVETSMLMNFPWQMLFRTLPKTAARRRTKRRLPLPPPPMHLLAHPLAQVAARLMLLLLADRRRLQI
jgi:hypothetical protein